MCYTFTAISSTEHQTHVGLLSINALRHDTNVTLGMERTILFLLSCSRQSAALVLCHCGSHSPKRLTDCRAETFADCHAVPMSVASMQRKFESPRHLIKLPNTKFDENHSAVLELRADRQTNKQIRRS